MHMPGDPRTMHLAAGYADVVGEVRQHLVSRARAAVAAGVDPERICIDPGIGFGKNLDHNLELLARLGEICIVWLPGHGGNLAQIVPRSAARPPRSGRARPRHRDHSCAGCRAWCGRREGARCPLGTPSRGAGVRYGAARRGQWVKVTGLKPRGFVWVIAGRLATCERIGGTGVQHRRVRREEELVWLSKEAGVTTIVSLLSGGQNVAAYQQAGFRVHEVPVIGMALPKDTEEVFEVLDGVLADPSEVVLVHRDGIDDTVAGILGGYLVHSDLLDDQVMAAALIQEIIGRPLGPEGRALIPSPRAHLMFERFTQQARRVVVLAQEEARHLDHDYIGTEHLMLGLIADQEGVAARVLRDLGIEQEAARQQVVEIIGRGEGPATGHVRMTPRAKKVLELSLRESIQLKDKHIGPEHILLGLLREGDGVGAQVLVALGTDLATVRERVSNRSARFHGGEDKAFSRRSGTATVAAMTPRSTDEIRLTGISVRAHHGVYPDEQEQGQEFVVDLVARSRPVGSGESDRLEDTVDYGDLAQKVHDLVATERWNLLERVAARVADLVLDDGRVREVEVTVHKPQAPMALEFSDVSVTVRRCR